MISNVLTGPAIISNGDGTFRTDEIEVDPPGPGEVRVEILAAGVCHTDFASLHWAGPLVMGHEGAGKVESVGAGVQRFRVGQKVLLNWAIPCGQCRQCLSRHQALCERTRDVAPDQLGSSDSHVGHTRYKGHAISRAFRLGTFARYAIVREEALTGIPLGISCDVACILGCAVMTGVGSAINVAAVSPGDAVAVVGCGGVGLNVIQGARIAGAEVIIAVDRISSKLERAGQLGATHLLEAVNNETVIEQVMEITDRRGVDHAFEATGISSLAFFPLRLVRNGGNAIQVSGAHGTGQVELRDFFWNKRYLASLYGGCSPERDFPRLFKWADEGKLEVASMISHRYTLDRLQEAFDDMLSGRSEKGVLEIR